MTRRRDIRNARTIGERRAGCHAAGTGPAAWHHGTFATGYLKTYFTCAPTMLTCSLTEPLINP